MAKRIDDNQREIVKAFRELGWSVLILSEVGKGCPDLLIGALGMNFLVEVKNGKKPPSAQRLTEYEQKFFENWKGQANIIKSTEDVAVFTRSILSKYKV